MQFAVAAAALARRLDGAKAGRQPIHGATGNEPPQRFRPRHLAHQPALDIEPEVVLADGVPGAYRVLRIMLEQHFDPVLAAQAQALAESSGQHDVAAFVHLVEDAGIAGETPVHIDRQRVHQRFPPGLGRTGRAFDWASFPARCQANCLNTSTASVF